MRLLALAYKVKLNFKLQLLTWNRRLDWDGDTEFKIQLKTLACVGLRNKFFVINHIAWYVGNGRIETRNEIFMLQIKQQNNLIQDFVWLTKCHMVIFMNPEPSFCQISNPFSFKLTDTLSNESTRFFLNTFFPLPNRSGNG